MLKPSSLPKSYVSFLNKHGGKDVSILKGINQLAFNTKPFSALKGIEDHYRSTGVDIKLDPEMTIPCTVSISLNHDVSSIRFNYRSIPWCRSDRGCEQASTARHCILMLFLYVSFR